MIQIGQQVQQTFGGPVKTVLDLEPELIENGITQWTDEFGTVSTGKFMDTQFQNIH
ncbi:hypothetical protein [Flavobacterium tegetincola]|uniref:hypothetical protein n=1 Tax=Flavobacterium tegetincola TaxID=150172 RepID=UPI00040FA3A5|nr:hypothetical protein [Flavobacterium tegetincola]